MRILSRYILKEVLSHSLLGLLIFSFVIFIPHISRLLEMVVEHNLTGGQMGLLFLLPLPSIVILTIPMAVLVGILIGLSRMAADGEVVAARATGIGLGQFARPVMLFALMGWAAASAMSFYLAPAANRTLHRMETRLAASQAPYEIQPRVFIEQFKNLLIYLEDVTGSRSRWQGVFIADTSQRGAPKITLAESGILVNDPQRDRLVLHLEHGTTHEADLQHPERYSVISFSNTDIPIPLASAHSVAESKHSPEMMSMGELLAARHSPTHQGRLAARVQFHYRLALPFASLVLALVGMPLGLFTRKGGKALGLMAAILLVFTYYVIMAFGLNFAKQGRIPAALGLWLANGVFALVGLAMLVQMHRTRKRIHQLLEWFEDLGRSFRRRLQRARRSRRASTPTPHPALQPGRYRFFQILDVYIIRGWLFYFVLLLVTFCGIYVIFDFFQLLGDIVRNHVAFTVVVNYYRYLMPQVVFLMLPLSILVATLVSFGLLTKTHQVTAIKSAGISLYRIAAPVLLAAFLASVGMFVLEDAYLPSTNQRQDALRNEIKGKPAQTYYRPDRQWIFGESNDIFNYRFFDADRNVFANLSVFEFNPKSFTMTRRIYASRAFWEPSVGSWVLERGWVRNLSGDRVTLFQPFVMRSFPELKEPPAYFKKEVKPSAQMSVLELRRYIGELTQSGFDVVRLSVQFYRKFSFPLMAFVVALIGIPFSFSMGSKGALAGIALSIGIAIVYWSTSSLFEAMGNLNQLPAVVAAWSPDVLFGLGGVYLFLRVKT